MKSEHTYFLLQLSLHAVYIHAYSAWYNWSLFACFPCALCCVVLFLVGLLYLFGNLIRLNTLPQCMKLAQC